MGRATRKNNSAGGNMRSREESAYPILTDVQDALYDVTNAKDKVEQIQGQIDQAFALRDDPGEGAKALDHISLLIRVVSLSVM